jgi:hypothetical protein
MATESVTGNGAGGETGDEALDVLLDGDIDKVMAGSTGSSRRPPPTRS